MIKSKYQIGDLFLHLEDKFVFFIYEKMFTNHVTYKRKSDLYLETWYYKFNIFQNGKNKSNSVFTNEYDIDRWIEENKWKYLPKK